ncbi:MAG: serine--tRNA ligase [bacterium]|jgi:seryl-tRNA synthetase|nr:serine--tRNA ligase [bacterium]MDD4557373.1 serine--tRNA ligase [bacterium]
MLDMKLIRQNPEIVAEALRRRHSDIDLTKFQENDRLRRELLIEVEALKNKRNEFSRVIGERKRNKQNADELIAEMQVVSSRIKELDEQLQVCEATLNSLLLEIPNIPLPDVPEGIGEQDNVELRRWSEPRSFAFEPLAHWDLGEKLDILDFERGARLAGARFTVMKGAGALLERALVNFMLDLHTGKHGYREIFPPFLVNADAMTGTGQLPKFEEDLFKTTTGYYLIPTAEVPVTNLHREEILDDNDLPVCYAAYTACFRAEAGSYGKDTRGLIRQHQFNKVELVKLTRPEDSAAELEKLIADAEEVLQLLGLPYRVIILCTADLGFSSAKTYDIEVWFPQQGLYREISSCSSFTDFQARRAGIRYRSASGRTEYVHTINGSGLAVGRCLAAILENYQTEGGNVIIPEALRPYMGGKGII